MNFLIYFFFCFLLNSFYAHDKLNENNFVNFEIKAVMMICNRGEQLRNFKIRDYVKATNTLDVVSTSSDIFVKMKLLPTMTKNSSTNGEVPATMVASDGYIATELMFSSGSLEAQWAVNDFWRKSSKCMKLMKKSTKRECIKIYTNFVLLQTSCLSVQFEMDKYSWEIMSMVRPVSKPPKVGIVVNKLQNILRKKKEGAKSKKSLKLSISDAIECSAEDIKPKPTLQWHFTKGSHSLEEYWKQEENVIGIRMNKDVEEKTYNVCCAAINMVFGVLFSVTSKFSFTTTNYPSFLKISPNRSIFYRGESITCHMPEKLKCKWIHVSGPSDLQVVERENSCRILIRPKMEKGSLIGGLNEWACGVVDAQQTYSFQRKLFYVYVPPVNPPLCMNCNNHSEIHFHAHVMYKCHLNDHHFPKALLTWEYYSGNEKAVEYFNDGTLKLHRTINGDSEVVMLCVAYYPIKTSKDENSLKFVVKKSKSYTFDLNSHDCPIFNKAVNFTMLGILFMLLLILIIFDVKLFRFIHQLRINSNLNLTSTSSPSE